MVRAMHAVGTGHLVAGRYRLGGQIGRGAMGIVWRGRDELLDRDVAVKQVRTAAPGTDADDGTAYQRTLREARTAARLSHPGVVTVFDVVEEDASPWIVMELVRARSLDQVVAEDGPLRPAEAAGVGERLLSALACAHAAGVLHRDVKPSNVLITPDGGAVLTDFGIATLAGDPGLTQAGMVVGTPGFTAPERVRGAPATPASDLWSLGATLYAAVEGRGPFDRPGGSAVITAGVLNEDAPRAPSAGPLGPVIEALLRTDPGARPDTATSARLLAGVAGRARPEPLPPGGRWPGQPAAGQLAAAAGQPGAATGQPGTATGQVRAAAGQVRAAAGQAAAGSPAPGAPGPFADAATARMASDDQTVPREVSDLPGSPAFADIHEFPDLPLAAETSGAAELPAFLDLPLAGAAGLPPGQAAPWSQPGSPSGPFPLEPAAPCSQPGSPSGPFPLEPAAPCSQPGSPSGAGPADPAGRPGAAGTVPPHPPGRGPGRRPGNGRQARHRRRVLVATAGLTAAAVAGLIAWTAFPHPVNAAAGQRVPSSPPSVGGPAAGSSPRPGSQAAGPASPGSSSSAAGAGGVLSGAASSGTSTTGSTGQAGTGPPGSSGQPGGSQPGSGGQTGGSGSQTGGASPPPVGYRWLSVPAASTGTPAGFEIAIPDSWSATRQGLAWYLDPPAGSAYIEVNLTLFSYPKPVRQAQYLQATAIRQDEYPGYRLIGIAPVSYRNSAAASWRFDWRQHSLGRVADQELLFSRNATAGRQDYELSVSAPAPGFPAARAVFEQVLRTFRRLA